VVETHRMRLMDKLDVRVFLTLCRKRRVVMREPAALLLPHRWTTKNRRVTPHVSIG